MTVVNNNLRLHLGEMVDALQEDTSLLTEIRSVTDLILNEMNKRGFLPSWDSYNSLVREEMRVFGHSPFQDDVVRMARNIFAGSDSEVPLDLDYMAEDIPINAIQQIDEAEMLHREKLETNRKLLENGWLKLGSMFDCKGEWREEMYHARTHFDHNCGGTTQVGPVKIIADHINASLGRNKPWGELQGLLKKRDWFLLLGKRKKAEWQETKDPKKKTDLLRELNKLAGGLHQVEVRLAETKLLVSERTAKVADTLRQNFKVEFLDKTRLSYLTGEETETKLERFESDRFDRDRGEYPDLDDSYCESLPVESVDEEDSVEEDPQDPWIGSFWYRDGQWACEASTAKEIASDTRLLSSTSKTDKRVYVKRTCFNASRIVGWGVARTFAPTVDLRTFRPRLLTNEDLARLNVEVKQNLAAWHRKMNWSQVEPASLKERSK